MGKGLHFIFGAALLFFAAEGTDTINIIPEGILEYLVLLVGVLMILVPYKSSNVASQLAGIPNPTLFGISVRIWFIIFGAIVTLSGLSSLVGLETVFGWIGLDTFGSLFDVLSVYTLTGRWILVGVAVIYLLSINQRGTRVIPL